MHVDRKHGGFHLINTQIHAVAILSSNQSPITSLASVRWSCSQCSAPPRSSLKYAQVLEQVSLSKTECAWRSEIGEPSSSATHNIVGQRMFATTAETSNC